MKTLCLIIIAICAVDIAHNVYIVGERAIKYMDDHTPRAVQYDDANPNLNKNKA